MGGEVAVGGGTGEHADEKARAGIAAHLHVVAAVADHGDGGGIDPAGAAITEEATSATSILSSRKSTWNNRRGVKRSILPTPAGTTRSQPAPDATAPTTHYGVTREHHGPCSEVGEVTVRYRVDGDFSLSGLNVDIRGPRFDRLKQHRVHPGDDRRLVHHRGQQDVEEFAEERGHVVTIP